MTDKKGIQKKHFRKVFILFPLIFGILCSCAFATPIVQKISSGWEFRARDEARWHAAKVPGEVHLDLMRNNIIPDPYFRNNEEKVQWVEKEDWEYRTTFSITQKQLQKKNILLVFDGLDTYADVYVNGQLLLQADNMFRQWKIDVRKVLTAGNNSLRVYFHSAKNKVDSLAKAAIPNVIPDHARAYARKAQYHFGWDWGPVLIGCGIWKEVRIESFDEETPEKKFVPPVQVELVEKPDSIGKSFYFSINGEAVYMKGANYIPSDMFVTRLTKDDYRKILLTAKDANMNMLRIWGGGIYESDDFYDLCDSLDIYVWQDFMFAGAMVPPDAHFFENVKQEVLYQVKRLRHHKSIIVWCGNNEVDEAFHNWGWQKQFRLSDNQMSALWHDYKRLFQDSIPAWIKQVDSSRPYVSTSPKYGWGRPQSFTEGDSHYWGVWWGGEDFEIFESKTGRFVSEYGMQSMPDYASVLRFTEPQDRYLYSKVISAHQKAGNGFQKLNGYLSRYMIDEHKIPDLSVEDYVYLTQCVQYYGFKNMILIHRSKYPWNMGTLLWQLNDCWPVASWSITNYYGRTPKAAWYAVKNAYNDEALPIRDTIKPKDLPLTNPKITWTRKGGSIHLKASSFAKYVFVELENYKGKLSDNYFDLSAGDERIITIEDPGWKGKIKVKSLYDVFTKYK